MNRGIEVKTPKALSNKENHDPKFREKAETRLANMTPVLIFFLLFFFAPFMHASGAVEDSSPIIVQIDENNTFFENRLLHLRGDHNYPPFEYINEQGQPEGFNIDLMNAMAQATGLKIKIDLGPWEEVTEQLENNQIDAIMGMFYSKERDKKFDFSTAHFYTSYGIFVRNDSAIQSLEDAKDKKIIIQFKDLANDYILEKNITRDIIIKNSWSEVLKSLSNGEGDLAIVSRLQGTRLINELDITNIKVAGPPILQSRYCLAVTQGNSQLLAQLNEGLSVIKRTGKYDEIYQKWFGAYEEQPLSFFSVLKYFIWIFLPLFALGIAGFLWSWSLRKQVRIKTNTLNNELLERKRAEEALASSLSLLNAALESTTDGILVVDKNGCIKLWNQKFADMWKIPKEILSTNSDDQAINYVLNQLAAPDAFLAKVKELYEHPETLSFDTLNLADGQIFERYSQPQKIGDDIVGRVWSFRDITERKNAEEERLALVAREQAAFAEAEAARKLSNMKSMFISATSHELRTPLNSIIGFTSLTLDGIFGELNPEQKEHLVLVHSSGKHLLSLINDILDLSMIESGTIMAVVSEFNLKTVVEEAVTILKVNLNETTLELKVDVGDNKMRSDRTRLLQCLIHLIGNAIKFTEKGSVEITSKVIGKNFEISVIDTGIGIKKEDIPKIFGPFVRLQTPLTSRTSGTGLGLYLVKIIAKDVFGGDVEVESEFGKGSKFTLRVPVELGGKI